MLDYVLNISLLALGFGFVIFWHELGHFLAAKYVGIKVEQFAVGFGQAILAWRKGVGIRVGTTRPEYERRIHELLESREREAAELPAKDQPTYTTARFDAAARELGLGETEYRLNWIPLGGYVKMLGQDDMNPNAISDDPRAYPQKSVGARMLVISAGVIMNIILAAILFMGLFMFGHRVPPAVVGGVIPGSPASRVTQVVDGKEVETSLRVGDEILYLDGTRQDDWTKVSLTTALADPTEPTSIKVRHPDGTEAEYRTLPERSTAGRAREFLQLGIIGPRSLHGPSAKIDDKLRGLVPAEYFALEPGDAIVGVDGKPVNPGEPRTESKASDYHVLDAALQAAGRAGRNVKVEVRKASGALQAMEVKPRLLHFFGGPGSLNFAGMMPRTAVEAIEDPDSEAGKNLRAGDVIVNIAAAGDAEPNPTFKQLTTRLTEAGQRGQELTITVLREGQEVPVKITPKQRTRDGTYVLGFGPGFETDRPVVTGPLEGSAAAKAGIPSGAILTSVAGTKVQNWNDVHRLLAEAPAGQLVDVTATKGDKEINAQLALSDAERDTVAAVRYDHALPVSEQTFLRKADNPAEAGWWGVTETRDFILQFYVTLQRMFGGSISPKNLMGPLGIFSAGTHFAFKGMDWLVWFLAMISANLAVVNFLPIPVVDGGHFVFLLLEKVQGKPVSQRMQSIAQVVGLALLLGVFLLVTYQDIARMINPY